MYKDLVGKKVLVIVSTKSDRVMEYEGYVCLDDNECLKLRDVSINLQLSNMQASIFGNRSGSFYDNSMPSVIINKKYIVSVIER